MVGRELPNLRPHGEDHRGAGGGERTGMLRSTDTAGWRSWVRTETTRIHTALVLRRGEILDLLAIHFSSRA